LDNRFVEDDCPNEEAKVEIDTDKCDLQKEKEKQLDILESILGPSFPTKNREKSTKYMTNQKNRFFNYCFINSLDI
jgi:hypothetical protein